MPEILDDCPLCGFGGGKSKQRGMYRHNEEEYSYVNCPNCNSMFLSPMPYAETMLQMFGNDYQHFHQRGVAHCGEDQLKQVLRVIGDLKPGVFLDYGCGSGALLEVVSRHGWKAFGYDFSEPTAAATRRRTGFEIVSNLEQLPSNLQIDALNFGDVLGHFTDLNREFSDALGLLNPGGLVIAEGTLEANPNLFYWCLRAVQKFRPNKNEKLPYDVILATILGQRRFFKRHQLRELRFDIMEADHPAPARLSLADLRYPKNVTLYLLRKISKAISMFSPNTLGNRFFYVGVKEQ